MFNVPFDLITKFYLKIKHLIIFEVIFSVLKLFLIFDDYLFILFNSVIKHLS